MIRTFAYFLLAGSLAMVSGACSSDDGNGASPMIESVAAAADANLEPTTVGYAANMYIIHGSGLATTQKIYFNDTDTYFNPNLVTDTDIFVTIDRDTPYADVSNKLRVVTKNGEVEFDFIVAPPAPGVHSFNPINAADGQEITIYGSYFLNPTVTVGGNTATIVSNSLTEIRAILPAGSQNKKVTVTTISGSAEYGTAVGTAIYDDVFYSPWNFEAWNNHVYVTDFPKAAQGTTFIKKTIEGWGNIQGNWNWNDQLSNYTGIHFYLRSDDPGKLVWIVNGNGWGNNEHAIETTKDWKEVRLTWSQMGNPAAFQNLSFQEFTGSTHNYYIDNIGFTVD